MNTVASLAAVGLYGKHPAFGDFLSSGLPDEVQSVIEGWLSQMLPALRDVDEATWQARYDAAPDIRFWFGAALMHSAKPFCGVMLASRDKVGRRFPLVVGVAGGTTMPPVVDSNQILYDTLSETVANLPKNPGQGARAVVAHLHDALTAADLLQGDSASSDFWATRPDGDFAKLAADIAAPDHCAAAANRSYLWTSGPGGVAVHVADAIQSPAIINWLITDATRIPDQSDAPLATNSAEAQQEDHHHAN